MGVVVIPKFITQDICNQLNAWVDLGVENKWLDKGIDRGSNWNYTKRVTTRKYADRFDYPQVVYDVFNKITNTLQIADLQKSVVGGGKNGVVVSCTYPGGDTYAHIDPKEGNLEVLRCNILTRKADNGGKLFIGGEQININVGDLHFYLPSTVEHYVTTIEGETARVLWMFGYQCSMERFNKIIKNTEYKKWQSHAI